MRFGNGNRGWGRVVAASAVFVGLAASAASAVTFEEDFESGSLSPSKWLIPGHAQIVADPLDPTNHVLSFTQLAAGGDLFSVPLDLTGPTLTLSFDYLGLQRAPVDVGTDTGGFVIVDIPNSFSGYVLLGTSNAGGPLRPDMLGLTPGAWHHVSLTFPASIVQGGVGSKLVLEQWSGSPNGAGNAFFDNIQLTSVPEPAAAVTALASSLPALLARRRTR